MKCIQHQPKTGSVRYFSGYLNSSPIYLGRYIPQLQILFTRFNIPFIEKELGNGECSDTFLQIGHHLRLLFLAEGHDTESSVRIDISMHLGCSDEAILLQTLPIFSIYPQDSRRDFVLAPQLLLFHVRIYGLDTLARGEQNQSNQVKPSSFHNYPSIKVPRSPPPDWHHNPNPLTVPKHLPT